jgi:hypothetical protein
LPDDVLQHRHGAKMCDEPPVVAAMNPPIEQSSPSASVVQLNISTVSQKVRTFQFIFEVGNVVIVGGESGSDVGKDLPRHGSPLSTNTARAA